MTVFAKDCQSKKHCKSPHLHMPMSTTSMNISLPESLKDFVKERVEEEHYSNPSDYVRALIREDQKHRDELKEDILASIAR